MHTHIYTNLSDELNVFSDKSQEGHQYFQPIPRTKTLLNDYPLILSPILASKIGLNEAIFLQQLHYWLKKECAKQFLNKYWIYNTMGEWANQFPFWCERTIRRTILSLEKQEFIFIKNLNKSSFNRTKWYTINYEKLDLLGLSLAKSKQNDQLDSTVCPNQLDNLSDSYKYTKTTTKNTIKPSLSLPKSSKTNQDFSKDEREMLNIWNEVVEEGDKQIQLTEKRSKILSLKLRNHFDSDLSKWKKFCLKIASSKFLMGEITNFRSNIDWVLKEENFIKIQEGAYKTGDRIKVEQLASIDEPETTIDRENCSEELKILKHDLLNQVGRSTYQAWFREVEFIDTEPKALKIKAPTRFISSYIEQHYLVKIRELYSAITGKGEGRIEICYT